MFTVPPPADDETIEGCPVVRVTDTVHEMRTLLWALYYGRPFVNSREPMEFTVVAALARLAHKYHITDLRNDAVARIKTLYTDKFEDFTKQQPHSHELLSYKRQDAFEAVQLAHLVNEETILPVALYLCCQARFFEDHTAIAELMAHRADIDKVDLQVRVWAEEDLSRCLVARPRLMQAKFEVVCTTFQQGLSPSCTGKRLSQCEEALHRVKDNILSYEVGNNYHPTLDVDCLASCLQDDPVGEELRSFCAECMAFFRERDLAARSSAWAQLPRCFGLNIAGWA
ncbi:hypothetical protein EVJ58_g5606 [Rhodofomes roseus]|nr:hypothetical protein EVJ58_g5606 [Rhodofomes roseus]